MAVLCFIGDQISRAFVIIEPVKNVRYKGYCMKVIPLSSITPYTKDTEINLRELINTIPDLIWLKDKDGIFLSCNSKNVKTLRGSAEGTNTITFSCAALNLTICFLALWV